MNSLDLIPDLWGYIAAGVGMIAVYFGAVLRGRKLERKDREIEELNRRVATQQQLDQRLRENDGATDADIDQRLRDFSERKP